MMDRETAYSMPLFEEMLDELHRVLGLWTGIVVVIMSDVDRVLFLGEGRAEAVELDIGDALGLLGGLPPATSGGDLNALNGLWRALQNAKVEVDLDRDVDEGLVADCSECFGD
jgi:hypothetical protein